MSVQLRTARPEDWERLYRWRVDNNQYFFGESPTLEYHAHWIQDACQDGTQHIFIILAPEPVGTISLYGINQLHRRAEYGHFVIEHAERGKGYGHAALELVLCHAFDTLNLNRIYADIQYHNQAGLAVARSCGFHPEGIFWEHVCEEDIFRDVVRMAILRDEWYIRRQVGL